MKLVYMPSLCMMLIIHNYMLIITLYCFSWNKCVLGSCMHGVLLTWCI